MHLKGIACLFTPVHGPSTRACKYTGRHEQLLRLISPLPPPKSTHPVLIDDIYDRHQFASMGSERDVGDTANLNEALEHLEKKRLYRQQHAKLTRRRK